MAKSPRLETESPRLETKSQPSRRAGYLDLRAITPPVSGPRGADRSAIVGRSGSGKSFLAERLMQQYGTGQEVPITHRAIRVIFDPDEAFDLPGVKPRIVRKPGDVVPNERVSVLVYRPTQVHVDDPHSWNLALRQIFVSPLPVVLYIDEFRALKGLFPPRRVEGGNYLTAMLTRGRKRLKATLMSMQRPSQVDLDSLAQAEWFYQFDLPFDADRDRMAGIVGKVTADGRDTRERESLGEYEFLFYGPPVQRPTRMILVP